MMSGYLWAGGQLPEQPTQPRTTVLSKKNQRHLKLLGGIKSKFTPKEEAKPDHVIFGINWQAWQHFLNINDQFRWQSVLQNNRSVLIRTGLDATAVISYLKLIKANHKNKLFKQIKHIATGVRAADIENL